MNQVPHQDLQRRLREIIACLGVEYVLGVCLTTVLKFDPDNTTAIQSIFLWAHGLLGTYILALSILLIYRTHKQGTTPRILWAGLAAVLFAYGAGNVAASHDNDVAIAIMAFGFLAALACYGLLYAAAKASKQ
jgi:hypothetical protein